jgi:MFS family permease
MEGASDLTKEHILLGALKYRNFRLFFFGQSISLIGTWMQQVAMMWLVYRLSGFRSEFLLGLVGFCSQIPFFFVAPVAGVYSDRWNLQRTILATQGLAMLQAAVLAVLTLTGTVLIWHVLALSVCMGLINAFDMPARQAFLIQMVEGRESLANAIGLNSSMFNGARLVGPAIAGYVIAQTGEGFCFLLNALSYLAVLAALLAMRLPPPGPAKPPQHVLRELAAGFRYAFGFPPIREILLFLALINVAVVPLTVFMPVFATSLLDGGADVLRRLTTAVGLDSATSTADKTAALVYGLLTAALGLGALLGALSMAARKSVVGLGRQIAWTSALFGLGLIAFSFSRVLWLSLLLLGTMGFAVMMETAASNTILQTIVDDDKRGRVMSFYTLSFLGVAPLASLVAGSLAARFGAPRVVLIAGIMCIAGSLLFAWRLPVLRKIIRPIYRRIGILPDV